MKLDKKDSGMNKYPRWEGTINSLGLCPTDPMGSYTGRPADEDDIPVQDADDL